MQLVWRRETAGYLNESITSLRRAIGQYKRHYNEFKIGLTVDPSSRSSAHKRGRWQRMDVLYETKSPRFIAKVEAALIEYGWDTDLWKQCLNERGGGGGLRTGYTKYYVYIILR